MKKTLLIVCVLILAGVALWFGTRGSGPPVVPFAKATRATISNVLSTNGKVEPLEFMEIHVESRGLVRKILVHDGDSVRTGQVLAELSAPGLQDEIDAAAARLAQAHADLQTLQAGGRSADTADIATSIARLKSDRDAAQKNLESLQRLQQKQAATPFETDQARQAVQSLNVQIQSLEQKRSALVGKGDIAGAEARVREAEANLQLARSHSALNIIRAPMSGVVYDLPARQGSFLNIGDALASVGKLNPVRVRVFVDEPELGRVAPGEKVRITWDALPGKEWNGVVEKRPTEVISQGSRQVGEVLCTIDNPNRELVPGTNVNAFILTQVVQNALTIPKAAVRRDNGTGVFLLQPDQTVVWTPISTGASDALRVEVLQGLKEGDAAAEPADTVLKTGIKVKPVFPQ